MEKKVLVYERYISNPNEVKSLQDLGIDGHRLIQYRYRAREIFVEEIVSVIKYRGNDFECGVRLSDGERITIKENHDDFFIRINDVKNGTIENNDNV